MVVDKLAEYLANADSDKPSMRGIHTQVLEELHQFVRQELPGGGVRYAADYGCHDDLVMSLAIALWATLENSDLSAPAITDSSETVKLDLTKMRKIRSENIASAELAEVEAWDSFVLGGGYEY
jgi:hypothetical protein